MHPVTYEYFSLSRVHPHRDRDHQRPAGVPQALVDVGIEAQPGGDPVELGEGRPMQLRVELGIPVRFPSHAAPFPLTAGG